MATRDKWNAFSVSFQKALRSAGEEVSKAAGKQLTLATEDWLANIDKASEFDPEVMPFLTGNLHDSMATTVSQKGRLLSLRQMEKVAAVDQKYHRRVINGHFEGIRVAMSAPRPREVTASLFIGVPYADAVNDYPQHAGYVERLEESFASEMERKIKRLEKLRYKTR